MRSTRPADRRPRTLGLWLLLVLFAALPTCSDDGTDLDPLASLTGTWDATRMVVTSKDDPDTGGDIIELFGASFTLEIRSGGRYAATLVVFEQTETEEGEIELSGSTITFDPDGSEPPRDGTWSLEDGTLVIDGDTSFDFNQDGTPESADLHLELVRR